MSAILAVLLLAACDPSSSETSPSTGPASPSPTESSLTTGPVDPAPTESSPSTEPADPSSPESSSSAGSVAPSPGVTESSEPPAQENPLRREITYNPYQVPTAFEPLFDDAMRAEYARLINAIMERKETIPVNPEMKGRKNSWLVTAVLSQINPVGTLVSVGTLPGGKELVIDYYYDEAEHARMVASIAPKIESLVGDLIPMQANELDAALAVYEHLARTTDYTQMGPLTGPYGVLIDSSGMCVGFATGMSWLLQQAGFPSFSAIEWTPTDPEVEGHAWVLMSLGGEHFHLDPTFENGENKGQLLSYFGMTDEQRLITVGGPFTSVVDGGQSVASASDDRFAPLREAVSFALDPVAHTVELHDGRGNTSRFSTETFVLIDENDA